VIHYVAQVFPKLSETFVVDEILGLEAAGESVIIDSLEPVRDEPRHEGAERLRVRYLPEQPSRWQLLVAHTPLAIRRPWTWLKLARRARTEGTWEQFRHAGLVARRTQREGARCVHTHFAYPCADVGGIAAALAGRPFALTAHANDIWQETNAPYLGRRLRLASAVVTPTEYNARHLEAIAPGVPVHVLPYAVEEAEHSSAPADGPVLCVARLVPKKGVDVLIRALRQLAESHPDVRLEVIGDGHLEHDLRALATELGLGERVDFRGPQPPAVTRDAYGRCSAFALACRIAPDGDRDGLPVVLLEALAHGLPVVTTDVIGIPEAVRDHVNGLLVPPDDSAALAEALAEVLSDRSLAVRLGAAGRSHVLERHTPEARLDALRGILSFSG
jgi:glycosyltransferase involved in cell wall biosynthesis